MPRPGDAFLGMARSLSLSADRLCLERGLPATQEDAQALLREFQRQERLDLALCMLEPGRLGEKTGGNEVGADRRGLRVGPLSQRQGVREPPQAGPGVVAVRGLEGLTSCADVTFHPLKI